MQYYRLNEEISKHCEVESSSEQCDSKNRNEAFFYKSNLELSNKSFLVAIELFLII